MKVQVKELSGCEKLISIDVPSEWVTREYAGFYEGVARRAKVPGFRPGHAPSHVVKIHFQKEARDEVLKQLLMRSFREAVKEKEIAFIGEPKIDLLEFDEQKLKYNAHVESRPKIKVDRYTGLSFERKVGAVPESEIDEVLKRLQESQARYQPVEGRAARIGDHLICDYVLTADQKELERQSGSWVHLQDEDYLKGFSVQLVGAQSGDIRTVQVTFPEDYPRKELAGLPGQFAVTIKEMKEKILPPLDDELAKSGGHYETLETLKTAIRADLEARKKHEADIRLEREIFEELLKRAKFEVPKGFVSRRAEALAREEVRLRLERGVKEEEASKDYEVLKKNFHPEAERQVRISFLLDEIASRENIRAQTSDLEARYQLISERVRRPVEEIKGHYDHHEEARTSLLAQLTTEKTVQWIRERSAVKDAVHDQGGRV